MYRRLNQLRLILYLHMHRAKNYTNKVFPPRKMPPRTRQTARKSTGPIGVPRHQLPLDMRTVAAGAMTQ
jgi:hypothetical protein